MQQYTELNLKPRKCSSHSLGLPKHSLFIFQAFVHQMLIHDHHLYQLLPQYLRACFL